MRLPEPDRFAEQLRGRTAAMGRALAAAGFAKVIASQELERLIVRMCCGWSATQLRSAKAARFIEQQYGFPVLATTTEIAVGLSVHSPHVTRPQGFQRIERLAPADATLAERHERRVEQGIQKQREHERHINRARPRPAQPPRQDSRWQDQ